jgi:DNA-binding Lrp family transcriptional regulator
MKGHQGVKDVARVTGPYDVIVVLEGAEIDDISDTVTNVIHPREGVLRTVTCVSIGSGRPIGLPGA